MLPADFRDLIHMEHVGKKETRIDPVVSVSVELGNPMEFGYMCDDIWELQVTFFNRVVAMRDSADVRHMKRVLEKGIVHQLYRDVLDDCLGIYNDMQMRDHDEAKRKMQKLLNLLSGY